MAGQRVYRDFILEDYRSALGPKVIAALIAEDHSFAFFKAENHQHHIVDKTILKQERKE